MDVTFSDIQLQKNQSKPKTDHESNCTYCGLGFDCTSPRGMLLCTLLFICYFLIIVGVIILIVHIYVYPLHFLTGIIASNVNIKPRTNKMHQSLTEQNLFEQEKNDGLMVDLNKLQDQSLLQTFDRTQYLIKGPRNKDFPHSSRNQDIEETESSTSGMTLQELGEGLLIGLLRRK